jgi:Cof subfamily protein (haloacid dehalogenase superfamily)
MNFNAICTDIDGTLLNRDRQISDRTIRAFKSLPAGFPVILASSRMPSAMWHLLEDLGRNGSSLVCYNGGYVIGPVKDSRKVDILDSTTISPDICGSIVSLAAGSNVHISLYTADEWYAPRMDPWTEREERITKVAAFIQPNTKVLTSWKEKRKGAHKVMCMGDTDEIDSLYNALQEELSDRLHLYRSRDTYIEIAPRQISKASGLALILERKYGIGMDEVIAFGDNYNDVELLRQVGMGVAVANAREEVKAVAKEITGKSTEDGVAIAIEKYLL